MKTFFTIVGGTILFLFGLGMSFAVSFLCMGVVAEVAPDVRHLAYGLSSLGLLIVSVSVGWTFRNVFSGLFLCFLEGLAFGATIIFLSGIGTLWMGVYR